MLDLIVTGREAGMDSRLRTNVSPFIGCEDSTWQRGDSPELVAEM